MIKHGIDGMGRMRNDDLKLLENSLLSKADQPAAFFAELREISLTDESEEENNSYTLIRDLSHIHGLDISSLAVRAIDDGIYLWDIFHLLKDVIPVLDNDVDSITLLLEKFYSGMQGDYFVGQQYTVVEQLAYEQPQFARKLLDRLLSSAKPYIAGYISTIFYALRNNLDVHSELIVLSSNESIYVVRGVIHSLSRLDYVLSDDQAKLDATLDVFNRLMAENDEDTDAALCGALGNLVNISEEPKKWLSSYSKYENPNVQWHVSNILLQHVELNQEKWFKDCMEGLVKTSCINKGTINNLDYICNGLIEKGEWVYVESYLMDWVMSSDFVGNSDYPIDKLFGSTINSYTNNIGKLQTLITNYINCDNSSAHVFITSLMRFLALQKITNLRLDIRIVNTLDVDDVLYVCRKILGYIFDRDIISSLIISILDKKNIDDQTIGLVTSIFRDHIGKDYAGFTVEYLKDRVSKEKNNKIKTALSEAIKRIEGYQNNIEALHRLKELFSPSNQRRQILLEESKKFNKSMENVQKESFIQQLCTNIQLKHGRGWFSLVDGEYGDISPLKSMSHSIEMPRSEIVDPVGSTMDRLGFRRANRGD